VNRETREPSHRLEKGGKNVRRSKELRDAMVRFCERLSAGDVANFDELVSQEKRLPSRSAAHRDSGSLNGTA